MPDSICLIPRLAAPWCVAEPLVCSRHELSAAIVGSPGSLESAMRKRSGRSLRETAQLLQSRRLAGPVATKIARNRIEEKHDERNLYADKSGRFRIH